MNKYALSTIAIATTLSAALLSAPLASADAETPNEIAFVSVLDKKGISYSSEDNAIAAGHAVCGELDRGVSLGSVIRTFWSATGYTPNQSGYIVGASIAAFCPEHRNLVPGA